MEYTLVIMAAGIGSRFGERIKQLEPVGPHGELIIEYSVYDAVGAGFNHVVFVIRKDIEALVREKIGDRLSKHVKISYAFQEKEDIPVKKKLAPLRKKPWGTGQAVLSAKKFINGPFAIINADDFYGADAFNRIFDFLQTDSSSEYGLCGFRLCNTLSENGTVTRSVCTVHGGLLEGLEETKNIKRNADGSITGSYNGEARVLTENAVVSMNMWGFNQGYMDILDSQFRDFLTELDENTVNDGEFLVPIEVDKLNRQGRCSVRVLETEGKWFGMTYADDAEAVRTAIAEYVDRGIYPEKLFKE